jgi:N-acetylglucosamine-6-sulfatase
VNSTGSRRPASRRTGLRPAVDRGLRRSDSARPVAPEPAARPVPGEVTAPAPRAQKPNVLMVMTDDMRYDELRYLPHVREFIEDRGTDFTNSFAPTPLCCPNRASFLTGEFPHNHGVWWHEEPWGYGSFDDSHTLGGALQDAGYATGYVGKYLNRYGIAAPKAAPGAAPVDVRAGGVGRVARDAGRGAGAELGPALGRYLRILRHDRERERHPRAAPGRVQLAGAGQRGNPRARPKFTAGRKPWFLQVNSLAPHHGLPVEPDDPFLETPARPDWVKGRFDAEIGHAARGSRRTGTAPRPTSRTRPRSPPTGATPGSGAGSLRSARPRASAPRRSSRSTATWPASSARLKASGELDDTLVVFTSDNGYMLGEHRWLNGKVIGFEPSYRVPLLIAGPGVPVGPAGRPGHHRRPDRIDPRLGPRHLPKADGVSFVDDLIGQHPAGTGRSATSPTCPTSPTRTTSAASTGPRPPSASAPPSTST